MFFDKKPELKYPDTYIIRTYVGNSIEYSLGVKTEPFFGKPKTEILSIFKWCESWEVDTSGLDIGDKCFDSDKPIKEAIDNLRKDIENKHRTKLKQWERRNNIKTTEFIKYP